MNSYFNTHNPRGLWGRGFTVPANNIPFQYTQSMCIAIRCYATIFSPRSDFNTRNPCGLRFGVMCSPISVVKFQYAQSMRIAIQIRHRTDLRFNTRNLCGLRYHRTAIIVEYHYFNTRNPHGLRCLAAEIADNTLKFQYAQSMRIAIPLSVYSRRK